jgi:hypothetical protein
MTDPIMAEGLEAVQVSRLDVLSFVAAVIAGAVVYFLLRALGVHQVLITGGLVGIMFVYAIVVSKIPRLRVRLDQAGDNAYYLGLLFTLLSMAVALSEFGASQFGPTAPDFGEAGAKQIVGNFGIALGTTIAGIFIRVVLYQLRVDPADVESMTRIELAQAAKRMRGVLDSISQEMGSLLDQVRQRTSDQLSHLIEQVRETLADYTREVATAARTLTESANSTQTATMERTVELTGRLTRVASEAEAAFDRLRQVEPPPLTLSRRLNSVSGALEGIMQAADRSGQAFEGAGSSSNAAGQALAEAAGRMVTAAEAIGRAQADASRRLEEVTNGVIAALSAVGTTLKEDHKQLSDLEQQSARSAKAAVESQIAAQEVLANLVSVTRGLAEWIDRKG